MITLDGSIGEGGGQVLRTALALSMVTLQPFRIEKIRAKRRKPGLMRQHLTAVNAAAAISSARVDGAAIGAQSLTFAPSRVKPDAYTFSVGTAGSASLVLQAILPALMLAGAPSSLVLEGGTHNPHAPPFEFLESAFLPLVNRMGPKVVAVLERAGFYPAGGGRISVEIEPVPRLAPLRLLERGAMVRRFILAQVAGLPGLIARREAEVAAELMGWGEKQMQIRQLPEAWGPGNILTLHLESEHVAEVFTGFGERSVTAEDVAKAAVREARDHLALGAPVGQHLADQLLLPIALAGAGAIRTHRLTLHSTTNIEVIQRFLPVRVSVRNEEKTCVVEMES